jgi:transposase
MRKQNKSRSHPNQPHPIKSVAELERLAVINPHAAGLDIGAREIWAAVSPHHDGQTARCFGTFTPDLMTLADWLLSYGVTTVVMESTGVYWIPIFELLEARGVVCYLVNSRAIKHVPGRKSDLMDCQWLQKLHTLGLLNGSFRPDAEMRTLRTYLRHRQQLIEHRAPHILHMQKAMQEMNIQLHHVLSDITGVTGLQILRAIVAGERDPKVLASFRQSTCKADIPTIIKALTGNWQAEYLFILRQSLALYDEYSAQIATCNEVIAQQFATVKPRWDAPAELPVLPPVKKGSRSKNKPADSTRQELFRITGVDLVAVDGLSASLAQSILSEVGTDMSRFLTDKHFCSWLGLAPHNDISGGKVLRSYTLKTDNRAGQAFRQAAAAVVRSDSAFGAFYRRKRGQLGKMQALVATAHKIARTVYHMLKDKMPYRGLDAAAYETQQRERAVAALKRKAAKLGFTVVEPVA